MKIVAVKAGGTEMGDDAFAVGDGRGGAVWVVLFDGRFGVVVDGAGGPEELAVASIDAEEGAAVGDGLRDEDAVFPDDGRAVAGFGEFQAPEDVLICGPGNREGGFVGGAVLVWAAPLGPVVGEEGDAGGEGEEETRHPRESGGEENFSKWKLD